MYKIKIQKENIINLETDAIGHCDTGSAVITPGFDLKAKYRYSCCWSYIQGWAA